MISTPSSRRVTFNPNNIALGKGTPFSKTKYDPHNCDICKIACNSKIMYSTHIKGKKHEREFKKRSEGRFFCDICNEYCVTFDKWESHMESRSHIVKDQQRFAQRIMSIDNTRSIQDNLLRCDICNLDCKSNIILQSHLTGSRHKKKIKMNQINELKDKKDPSVICELCGIFLVPELMVLHQQSSKHKKVDESKITQKPRNNTEYCVICDSSFTDLKSAVAHYQTSEHADNVKLKQDTIIWCETCKLQFPTVESLHDHQKGFKHFKIENKSDWKFEGTFKEKLVEKKKLIKELRTRFRSMKDSNEEKDESDDNEY